MAIRKVVGALSLLVTGCAYTGYPTQWPPLASPQEGCSSINGLYSNIGEKISKDPFTLKTTIDSAELTSLLLKYETFTAGGPIKIEINDNHTITISIGNPPQEFDYPLDKGRFYCSNGRLYVGGDWAAKGATFVGYMGHASHALSKASDGALIMEENFQGVGLAMYIPLAAAGRSWARFKAVIPDIDIAAPANQTTP